MDNQNSYGCRRCKNCDDLLAFSGAGARCGRGSRPTLPMTLPLEPIALLMDKAYEGDETRQLAMTLGYIPVVPPKENRREPWEYDKALYKRRNEVERLFRRLKGFRRIFARFEKLDVMFIGFIHFALIVEGLRFLC